jgi:cytidylate kinase
MTDRPVVIAVDGPAASGKGTLARRLAAHLGYAYLDTGLLYRAVGVAVLNAGGDPNDARAAEKAALALSPARLDAADQEEMRSDRGAEAASSVSVHKAVRDALYRFQRDFAENPPGGAPGAVLDGRDIGTVICPDADAKIFVDAAVEVRAERRVKELQERGLEAIHARVLQEMKARDARDRSRPVAPLKPADDAFVLDTSLLDADAAFAKALDFVAGRNKA